MSTAPSYDLNKRPTNIAEVATNRATQFSYEPGSTFKIITAAAAVESVPDWEHKSYYVTGAEKVGRHVIHDWQWWSGKAQAESKDLSEGIRDSSNITMWHFARQIGAKRMLSYAEKFGIGERIESPGLRGPKGLLDRKTQNWSAEQLANFSFGQGMMMTPLQLARVTAVIANKGVMMKPMLVKEVRDASGKVVEKYEPEEQRRVISEEAAREVGKMLERVTTEGTARTSAFVPGYRTAGKTGSAQKADGRRGYAAGRFISSLAGYVPAKNPKYVIVVIADEPKGSHWGSEVCGPPWAEIASKAMLNLRLREGASAPAPDPTWMKLPEKKN
jgi:cell division protein FtsI/penicillin-binding protein 2